jgi:hypothetical protein
VLLLLRARFPVMHTCSMHQHAACISMHPHPSCTIFCHAEASACRSFMLKKKGFPIFDFPGIDQKPKTSQPSPTI